MLASKENFLQEKYIAYLDENYWYSWIYPQATRKIINYLSSEKRGNDRFTVLDAQKLKEWIEARIGKDKKLSANGTVVVFSKDMIPNILAPDYSPSIILRSYLDEGGKIVWIGDIPFWRQGEYHEKIATTKEPHEVSMLQKQYEKEGKKPIWNEWQIWGPFSILGVKCEFNFSPAEKVQLTDEGKKWGEQSQEQNQWYGTRPIREGKKEVKVLAKSSARKPKLPELPSRERELTIGYIYRAMSAYLSLLAIGVSIITGLTSGLFYYIQPNTLYLVLVIISVIATIVLLAPKMRQRIRPKRYANAWIKNFNRLFPNAGFVRIWDCQLYDVTEGMLEDLFKVAIHGLKQERGA